MIDRGKVLKGLECCIVLNGGLMERDCEDCPYVDDEGTCLSLIPLLEDALALLKEQEPRVLTLDELRALYNTVHFVWVEDNGDDNCFDGYAEVDVYKEKVELFEFGNEVQWEPDNDNYGKTWRCWSSRPTDEQKEATLWKE